MPTYERGSRVMTQLGSRFVLHVSTRYPQRNISNSKDPNGPVYPLSDSGPTKRNSQTDESRGFRRRGQPNSNSKIQWYQLALRRQPRMSSAAILRVNPISQETKNNNVTPRVQEPIIKNNTPYLVTYSLSTNCSINSAPTCVSTINVHKEATTLPTIYPTKYYIQRSRKLTPQKLSY